MAKHKHPGGVIRNQTSAACIRDRVMNGRVTVEDLNREWQRGYQRGADETKRVYIRAIYTSLLLALHRRHGFGRQRLMTLVEDAERIQIEEMTTLDMICALAREADITLDEIDDITSGGISD